MHYLVWPLVEGEPLEAVVQRQGKLPPDMAALYALQVASGLGACHGAGVFHGLLKPSNIMIGSDQQARILDFGIGSLLAENEGESLVDTMSTANTLTSGLDCASPESIMEPTNRTPAGDQYRRDGSPAAAGCLAASRHCRRSAGRRPRSGEWSHGICRPTCGSGSVVLHAAGITARRAPGITARRAPGITARRAIRATTRGAARLTARRAARSRTSSASGFASWRTGRLATRIAKPPIGSRRAACAAGSPSGPGPIS